MADDTKLSVAVLLSGRAQFNLYYGGALVRWTYEVYHRLAKSMDVTVFGFPTHPEEAYPMRHQSSDWWRVCALMSRVPGMRRYEDHVWLRALISRLQRFEMVHIHNRPQWVEILRSLGYPGLIVLHLQNDHLGHWNKEMLDALSERLDGLAVCSSYLKEQSCRLSPLLARKTEVIFNGANTEIFFPREEIREPKTIFFVGVFNEIKGPLHLVRAYKRVLQRHPDAKLTIGGGFTYGVNKETSYVREVRATAASIQNECGGTIDFPGYIHHDRDLPGYFQRATLFSSPSLFQEPFGLVNAEAMACATPVVGSNRGGIPEVVGDTGRVIDPENTDHYAGVLSDLLSDSTERKRLGRAAFERCRRMFDWGVIAEGWEAYLHNRVLGNKAGLNCA